MSFFRRFGLGSARRGEQEKLQEAISLKEKEICFPEEES